PIFEVPTFSTLAEISWLRGGRQRKSLICKATIQKVATTFLSSSRGLLGELELAPGVCAAAVAAATPSPISPRPADVRLPVGCSAASPVPSRRPRAHERPASECRKGFPTPPARSVPARGLAAVCARSHSGKRPESTPGCEPR